ncbi:MAG: aminoacyl-tRNA hydrolase [Thiohalocapsa sp. PB-PSB1]|jgi:PTH1 family peptidyl-tRNA hydrolase|nr:MAG: hypothetical protein N838_00290 [Thiohalocapsa sp. PB-PSB1]QQO53872.1 MAG: aminoacyl-tRNA hydrolase [Thiohalocapsa sp. PB-PSB1]HCS90061.1 aminoacyl-tRNA hydrolase [Chromatiaceae bacterium]
MSDNGIRLIVGLGNPGPDHEGTRHNAGFWLVDHLAAQHRGQFRLESKFHGMLARITVVGKDVRLLKPMTYMNHSGRAVAALTRYFDVSVAQILVVYDELDLPVGRAKLKLGGGHAGHNGMRDIIAALGREDFWRLRVGIGHPGHKAGVVNYVLSRPSKNDLNSIMSVLDNADSCLPDLLVGNYQRAMNRLHTFL